MSKAAGTLITTYDSTYIPPRYMPGYRGHVPALKYDFGETYGNATGKILQDYRNTTLNSSKTQYANGGSFPTYYTHNPDLVISNRTRTSDRFLYHPHYQLHNVDHDRMKELNGFNKLAQAHREHYKDKSGTLPPVYHFQSAK